MATVAKVHDAAACVFKSSKNSASVFEFGKYTVCAKTVETSSESAPPKPLYIVTPEEKGTYPVLLLLHGFFLTCSDYSCLLKQVASHGFIAVAPQLYHLITPCSEGDIKSAAIIANWLFVGLQSLLPQGVEGDLLNLALAGHSRGGNAAFSLALGYADTTAKFSLLLGIDPVAGTQFYEIPPQILSKPGSFNLEIPVLVIGSGLESSCAPKGVNHVEFFNKCNSPRCHMVISDYGHLDMLDDGSASLAKCFCSKGKGAKDLMRRSIGGMMVAFLRAYIYSDDKDLLAIAEGTEVPPANCIITNYGK